MVKEMQNVIISRFEIESEAFQAFSVLKNDAHTYSCRISQASIVKRENGEFRILDAFNDGKYSDDTFTGGMIGIFIGILGGPLGVLLGGGIGLLAGGAKDSHDADKDRSLIECVISDVGSDCTFLVVLADESSPDMYDSKVSGFSQNTMRYDAAELLTEMEDLQDLQKDMERKAKAKLRDKKRAAHRERVEANRSKLRDRFREE